jgi:MFS superfamily sulfate permease-like transporter
MRRYALVSGIFLALLACVQLLRLLMRWPIRVGNVDVPLWPSVIAALIVGSLAAWAFRVASRSDAGAQV